MVRYISEKQLTIEEFKTPFRANLSAENRWVKLARVVPWDKFASIYMTLMSSDLGRPGVSPRTVLGALIIKHLEKLDDRGVIQAIQENLYMQYFVGLKEFKVDPVFDPSLFVEIRKRVGHKEFDSMSADLIRTVKGKKDGSHNKKHKKVYIPVENRTIFQLKTIPFLDAYLHSFCTNERRIKNDQNEYEAEDYSVQVPGWLYGAQDSTGAKDQS